jgi:glycosyltransferase involved in cell wall biosynthesis
MSERPLRIGFVISYFHPLQSGAERQALEQGAELVRQGHTVHVVTRRIAGLPSDETVRGTQVHRWAAVRDRGPLFAPSFVLGFTRALKRLRDEIDLVHTHQGLWEAVATGYAKRALRTLPTLVQPASSGYFGEAQELARSRFAGMLRRTILRNDAFAAISSDIAREWRSQGVPEERIHRTASGVDIERFHPGPSTVESKLPDRPRVIFTGRLHPQKNLGLLIDAWRLVREKSDAQLVVVGDGPARAELEARIEALGLVTSVHMVGAVPDVAEWLRGGDVFVLPSVAEGMSNSLLEAMATGLACVASRIGGNEDLITQGETGLLVPPDASAWAGSMLQLLLDPAKARRLGDAAAAQARSRYALPKIVAQNVEIYRRLLTSARGRR